MPRDKNTILIIDDDPDVIEIEKISLERAGYSVVSASNGAEGFKQAKSVQPDLIILDVLMPRQDGLTTFEELKNDPGSALIPVVLLTSVNARLGFGLSSDDLAVHTGKGPEAFLEKPVDASVLLRTVAKILSSDNG